jgi:hypothetical protein
MEIVFCQIWCLLISIPQISPTAPHRRSLMPNHQNHSTSCEGGKRPLCFIVNSSLSLILLKIIPAKVWLPSISRYRTTSRPRKKDLIFCDSVLPFLRLRDGALMLVRQRNRRVPIDRIQSRWACCSPASSTATTPTATRANRIVRATVGNYAACSPARNHEGHDVDIAVNLSVSETAGKAGAGLARRRWQIIGRTCRRQGR